MAKKLDETSQYKKIREDFINSLSALSEDHAEWREYDDFYLAKHWNDKRASWRPDPVINYIAYVVDQKAPQLTQNRPRGLILPTAHGDEEIAKIFTKVTDVVADRTNLDEVIAEVVPTGLLLGIGWFKVYWDNSKSGGRYDPLNPSSSTVWKGDICIEAPDPANIYHDPQAYRVEDCRYIIYAVPKTVEWIKEKFGVDVEAEQTFETDIYNRPSLHQAKNRVMLYEYWYKENGKINVIYAANGKILKEIKEVYKHGRYPFVPFVPKKKRKSLIGIGEPRNIINNQRLLNKFMEMVTSNTMYTANPILLVDDQSGVNENAFVAKPGIVQKVKNLLVGNPIKWLEPPNISTDAPRTIDKLIEVIERMAGIYDAQTGETPSGVTAAAAIQMLVDQGSIPIKGMQRNLHSAVKDVYELMIELIKEFYTEERYFRITEDDGENAFLAFRGAQYAEIDFDVQISAGSSTPTSKAYIAQLGADLFQAGVLLPSEYVEMQEGLPNKERIVSRLREQEQMMQQQDPAQQQELLQQQMMMQEQQRMRDFQEKVALKQMDNDTKMRIAEMQQQAKLMGVR